MRKNSRIHQAGDGRGSVVALTLALALALLLGLGGAGCKRSSRDCGSSPECAEYGACTARGGACVAASDSDCAPARECRVKGACQARDGYCQALTAKTCQDSQVCRRLGWCGAKNGSCAATGDPDCRGSEGCKVAGWCTAAEGMCVLGAKTDCVLAGRCAQDGPCSIIEGRCTPTDASASSADPAVGGKSDDDLRAEMERHIEEARPAADAGLESQSGERDADETRRIIAQHRSEIVRRCFDPLASSQPGMNPVRFELKITIAPTGTVSAASVEGGGNETAGARTCLATRARTWQFPPSSEPAIVSWVITYQPSPAPGSSPAAPVPPPTKRPTRPDRVFE